MGLLSGLEFAFILVVVGLLLMLGTRIARERRGLSPLLLLIVVVLFFALFSLSSLVVALFKFSLVLIVIVAVLIVSLMYTTIRH
jgi:hypothetical protein